MNHLIHQISQGSNEWHEFRAQHFGASEAAAMLGISPYMSRTELLHLKSTGESKEHSDFTKTIFKNGHEAEDLARKLIESEGLDFYPVVCSLGKLSASCDGLTIDNSLAFEHKLYSADLAEKVKNGIVPDHYMAQCQQILMITNADRLLFACSNGTLDKWEETEVFPDQSWFDRIKTGWEQFEKDLEIFEPREFKDKPDHAIMMQLPALYIQIKGEVTLSNLPEFKEAAETFIANINTNLITDEDFFNAEETIKFCKEVEQNIKAKKKDILGQAESIDAITRALDFTDESFARIRLILEKLVKTQKESIKSNIIKNAFDACNLHVSEIHTEFVSVNFIQLGASIFNRQNFETVCKSKRTLESLHNAVDSEIASIKIKLDELARVVRKNLTHLPDDLSLFGDLQSIITKPEDDFKLLVDSRIAEQKRREEESLSRAFSDAKIPATTTTKHSTSAVYQINQELNGFDKWWSEVGIGMRIHDDEKVGEFAKRVAFSLWNFRY
jgi:putative phage-type endonuclease